MLETEIKKVLDRPFPKREKMKSDKDAIVVVWIREESARVVYDGSKLFCPFLKNNYKWMESLQAYVIEDEEFPEMEYFIVCERRGN